VHFFHDAGLDYVSCSPFRVPVARPEAGRAEVEAERAAAGSAGGSDSR
jgi:pyruvate,orthophosphate dikinase